MQVKKSTWFLSVYCHCLFVISLQTSFNPRRIHTCVSRSMFVWWVELFIHFAFINWIWLFEALVYFRDGSNFLIWNWNRFPNTLSHMIPIQRGDSRQNSWAPFICCMHTYSSYAAASKYCIKKFFICRKLISFFSRHTAACVSLFSRLHKIEYSSKRCKKNIICYAHESYLSNTVFPLHHLITFAFFRYYWYSLKKKNLRNKFGAKWKK